MQAIAQRGEISEIVSQLRKSHEGGAWHGSALSELLADVSALQAAARPVLNAHSIWEIVLHIAAWNKLWARMLEGYPDADPNDGDWPAVEDTSQDAWEKTTVKLEWIQQRLFQVVAALPESRLPETVTGKDFSFRFFLSGILQHNAYHTGQIALLKKASSDVRI